MNIEKLSREELIEEITKLKEENLKLKEKKSNKRRNRIKTTKKQIVDYWACRIDECELSIDWAEAEERCWRCGYEKSLQKCHIIPDCLGGEDKPSNLVLLCGRCHIDAPNVESETFMWDWIKANKTTFYDTFFEAKALQEYEFIYGKKYIDELNERGILDSEKSIKFRDLIIGRSCNHFAHPWKNDSTMAGIFRMKLEAYDKIYGKNN